MARALGRTPPPTYPVRAVAPDDFTSIYGDYSLFRDLVARAFRARDRAYLRDFLAYRFSDLVVSVSFDVESACPTFGCFWRFEGGARHAFAFPPFNDDAILVAVVDRWVKLADFYKSLNGGPAFPAPVVLDFGDTGKGRGLTFCDNTGFDALIPDPEFVFSRGYHALRTYFRSHDVAWEDRSEKLFWRGSTTGSFSGDVLTMPRAKLCLFGKRPDTAGACDLAFSHIAQLNEADAMAIRAAGLMGEAVDWTRFGRYKYHVDIDGNSNSWPGLMFKLLSGGVVVKVESAPGYRQWYYDRLVPWVHFAPARADLGDLHAVLSRLRADDRGARAIARRGQELAMAMTLETELTLARERVTAYAMRAAGP